MTAVSNVPERYRGRKRDGEKREREGGWERQKFAMSTTAREETFESVPDRDISNNVV